MKKTNTSDSFRSGVHGIQCNFRSTSHSVLTTVLLFLFLGSFSTQAQSLCQLACTNAQVSVDENCQAEITVAMLADTSECPSGIFSAHVLTLEGDTIPTSPFVTEVNLGQTLKVTILDEVSGNSCWSYITVEDKMKPQISCNCPPPTNGTVDPNCIVSCADITEIPPGPLPTVTDNCTDPGDLEPILLNEVVEQLCDSQFINKVTRYYTAFDAAGNQADTCVEVLFLERLDFSLIDFPDSLTISNGNAIDCDAPFPVDEEGNPHPSFTGVPQINGVDIYPDFIFYCNAAVSYEDVPIGPLGCVRKIMRMWQVFEWHCQGERDTLFTQLIEIVDNEGPVIDCPPNVTISTDFHDCDASYPLQRPNAVDNCNDVDRISASFPGGFFDDVPPNTIIDLPVGANVITYTAYDDCGNSSECITVVTVADQTPPVPICDEHTIISLTTSGPNGLTKVPASVFDDGSYDECGDVTITARRMTSCIDFDWTTNGAGVDDIPNGIVNSRDQGTVQRSKVPFACCDVGQGPIMVELLIKDESGNTNVCMVEVEVQDKIGPQLECPPDITVSCEFNFDLSNLSVFGTVRTDEALRDEICLQDPENPSANLAGIVCFGLDGIAFDNCDVAISVDSTVSIDNCGTGLIKRTFTATDPGGRSTACVQDIHIINFTPFYINDVNCFNNDPNDGVIWPCDKDIFGCGANTTPENTGFPVFFEDNCDLIGYSFEDLVFPFVEGACFKILRTWQVIDWCQFESNPSEPLGYDGYWEYQQVIKVLNTEAPEFVTSQDPISVCNEFDCSDIFVELIQEGTDDCTPDNELRWEYGIDVNNDGTVNLTASGMGNIINASNEYPIGTHRIIYSFEDQCGSKTTREQIFEILACKPPTPICINGLSADLMPVDTDNDGTADWGMITIWASDFDKGSNHACGYPVTVSFSPDTNNTNMVFDCNDVGPDGVPVQLWVTDRVLGNQAFCETYIIIQDNMEVCPENPGGNGVISGTIETRESDFVASVEVSLDGSAMFPVVTSQTGDYAFPVMPFGGNYTVKPGKNDDFMNGVSTLDLVHIQKHLLGIQPLSSPYDLIAADANNSGSVSAVDLVELRKLILGVYEALPSNTSWRFVEKNYTFPDPNDPWQEAFPESYVIQEFNTSISGVDFTGVKVGDVNNSVQANLTTVEDRSGVTSVDMIIEDMVVQTGEYVEIPVRLDASYDVIGYQFTVRFDEKALAFKGMRSDVMQILDEHIASHQDGSISVSWNDIRSVSLEKDQDIFYLMFEARTNGAVSNMIALTSDKTKAEIYTGEEEIRPVSLVFNNRLSTANTEYALYQNQPNPFSRQTMITYTLPSDQEVLLQVFDINGKLILDLEQDGQQGLNQVELTREQLKTTGLLYYSIQADSFTATRKMLMVE